MPIGEYLRKKVGMPTGQRGKQLEEAEKQILSSKKKAAPKKKKKGVDYMPKSYK